MAQYEMQESTLPSEGGKRILYPRMRLTGQDTLDDLVRRISRGTTFSPGDVRGLIGTLVDELAFSMGSGRSVKIEGLGVFTPALGLREGAERESGEPGDARRNASSICVSGVHFKVDKRLVMETAGYCQLERSAVKFRKSSNRYTPQERLKLAQDYLVSHEYMTVEGYASLTGLRRTTANRELNAWCNEPGSGIGYRGRASHKVYVRQG